MKKEQYICDIAGCSQDAQQHTQQKIQVIFQTEQTEGRSSPNYLDTVEIDLCDVHHKKLLKGKYIFADGAMGHNRYNFKS